jgi:hypothetical protein
MATDDVLCLRQVDHGRPSSDELRRDVEVIGLEAGTLSAFERQNA